MVCFTGMENIHMNSVVENVQVSYKTEEKIITGLHVNYAHAHFTGKK